MREFGFELRLCDHLERESDGIVSRQLGTSVHASGGRIMDTVLVEPGPQFDARTRLTSETIPLAAIEADVGVGRWRRVTEALDGSPERARRLADRAVDAGFFEGSRKNGQRVVRQTGRYPDWFSRIVGVENKPDLGSPGDLETQLRKDVSLGILDEIVLATKSHVTRAHLNRIPEEVGVWRIRGGDGSDEVGGIDVEVIREAAPLTPEEPGVELLDEHPGRTDVAIVTAAEKSRQRFRVVERAYGKGWRTYDLPACTRVTPENGLPFCPWKGRLVNPAEECGASCDGYDAADPPEIDLDALRERRTAWQADPDGGARRQTSLDSF